jgi:adenine-specific DNA-methyltransferase
MSGAAGQAGASAAAAPAPWERFPRTRYLGSKRKLLGPLAAVFARLEFDTALDPFCGTGAVAYLLKCLGKRVTAADALEANAVSARALVENDGATLGARIDELLDGLPDPAAPPGFVEQTFDELFFERDENRFVDQLLERIHQRDGAVRDLALHALFQACLAKRPYNLFHRANLSLRRRDVARSFGNKATWDTPFPVLMRRFAAAADRAVFGGRRCRARCADALAHAPGEHDLVYLDPPYVSARGNRVDYLDYYHFLEGLSRPADWGARILHRYKHKPLAGRGESPWCDPARITAAFAETIARYAGATLVVSYRSDGIPSIDEITGFLVRAGKRVEIVDAGKYTYALSRNRRSREVVLVGC